MSLNIFFPIFLRQKKDQNVLYKNKHFHRANEIVEIFLVLILKIYYEKRSQYGLLLNLVDNIYEYFFHLFFLKGQYLLCK
jgi:hypothetical protein